MPPRSERRSPWPWMIVLGLSIMAAVNVWFAVVAVKGQDPVVGAYQTQQR